MGGRLRTKGKEFPADLFAAAADTNRSFLFYLLEGKEFPMGKSGRLVHRMAYDALFVALYAVLGYFTIPITDNVRFSFAGAVLFAAGLYYGPADSVIISVLGEFLLQLSGPYGLSPTTPLWCLPPLFRGLVVGIAELLYRKKGSHLEEHLLSYALCFALGSLLTTFANTGVIYLDGMIMDYPVEYTYITMLIRIGVSLASCAVSAFLVYPLIRALRKIQIQ